MDRVALKLPRSAARRTAVVAAMPEELASLIDGIPALCGRRPRVGRVLRAGTGHGEIVIGCTGEGRRRALEQTRELLEEHPSDLLIGIGTAGGLTASIQPGTIVVASRLQEGPREGPRPDPEWLARALALPGVVEATVLTSERVLCSAAEKKQALSLLAHEGPAVVDLESTAFAAAAARAGVPHLIVRVVCDGAGDDLPLDFNRCRRDDGRIDRFAVVRQAVFSPATARELLRLRRQVASASEKLARFVTTLLVEEEDRACC